jgi:hypothetical protein
MKNKIMDLERLEFIGKIAVRYYNSVRFNPTQKDFDLWIESLKEPMKSNFKKQGLENCKGVLNFKRFILELNDFGMDEYMKNNLSIEDYKFWKDEKA